MVFFYDFFFVENVENIDAPFVVIFTITFFRSLFFKLSSWYLNNIRVNLWNNQIFFLYRYIWSSKMVVKNGPKVAENGISTLLFSILNLSYCILTTSYLNFFSTFWIRICTQNFQIRKIMTDSIRRKFKISSFLF